jgi:hypothetical protein
MMSPVNVCHTQNISCFVHILNCNKALTVEALGQLVSGAGVELHEAVQCPGLLHPESQHVQCHAEHSATIQLLPAYEPLGQLHVLPLHIFLPAMFPRLRINIKYKCNPTHTIHITPPIRRF